MNIIIVGTGEFASSNRPNDMMKTVALGASVGVIFTVPTSGIAGLLHVVLPDSKIDSTLSKKRPGIFADTGIPALLREVQQLGGGDIERIVVKLAGGASIMDTDSTFDVGNRNILAIKKILEKFSLTVLAEDIGGSISRSVTVDVESGLVSVSSPGRGVWKI